MKYTKEELLKKDGAKFTATIRKIDTEGIITVEKNLVYLCQDKVSGADCSNKKGYKFSFSMFPYSIDSDEYSYEITDFKLIEEYTVQQCKDQKIAIWCDTPAQAYKISDQLRVAENYSRVGFEVFFDTNSWCFQGGYSKKTYFVEERRADLKATKCIDFKDVIFEEKYSLQDIINKKLGVKLSEIGQATKLNLAFCGTDLYNYSLKECIEVCYSDKGYGRRLAYTSIPGFMLSSGYITEYINFNQIDFKTDMKTNGVVTDIEGFKVGDAVRIKDNGFCCDAYGVIKVNDIKIIKSFDLKGNTTSRKSITFTDGTGGHGGSSEKNYSDYFTKAEIIGYELVKPEYKKVAQKALQITSDYTPFIIAGAIGYYVPKIEELGIMGWFKPVYKKELVAPEIRGYKLDKSKSSFGCVEIDAEHLSDLLSASKYVIKKGSEEVAGIYLTNGEKIPREKLQEIYDYLCS